MRNLLYVVLPYILLFASESAATTPRMEHGAHVWISNTSLLLVQRCPYQGRERYRIARATLLDSTPNYRIEEVFGCVDTVPRLNLSPDRRYLQYYTGTIEDATRELCLLDVSGSMIGSPTICMPAANHGGFIWSPDGRRGYTFLLNRPDEGTEAAGSVLAEVDPFEGKITPIRRFGEDIFCCGGFLGGPTRLNLFHQETLSDSTTLVSNFFDLQSGDLTPGDDDTITTITCIPTPIEWLILKHNDTVYNTRTQSSWRTVRSLSLNCIYAHYGTNRVACFYEGGLSEKPFLRIADAENGVPACPDISISESLSIFRHSVLSVSMNTNGDKCSVAGFRGLFVFEIDTGSLTFEIPTQVE